MIVELTDLKEEDLKHKLLAFVRKVTECVDQSDQLHVKQKDDVAVGNRYFVV